MNFLRRLLRRISEPEGSRLLREAFLIVEYAEQIDDLERAAELLRQSVSIEPDNPDAWNELAFVLARIQQPDEALHAAERAVALNSDNPKFHNAVMGIQFGNVRRAASRSEARPVLKRLLCNQWELAGRFPDYAAVQLGIAELLAGSGANEADWEAAIDRACALYEAESVMGANIGTTADRLSGVLQAQRMKCIEVADWWKRLPEFPES